MASAGKPPSWKWKGPEEKAGLVLEEEDEVVLVAAVLCSGPTLVAVLPLPVVDVDVEDVDVVIDVSGPVLGPWSGELSAVAVPSILSITPLAFLMRSLARLSLTRGLDCPMAPTEVWWWWPWWPPC